MSLDLIAKSDFVGFTNIEFNGIDDATFTVYADQLDKIILTKLFGVEMYEDIFDNPTTTPNAYLINNFLKDMQKGYFYYYFNVDRESFSTTLGEFQSVAENAVSSGHLRNRKVVNQYNEGVKWFYEAYDYVQENIADYPLYDETEFDDYINIFDL